MSKKTAEERFMEKVRKDPVTGCWLWTGAAITGYGVFGFEGKNWPAHRWAYMLFVGDLGNLQVCHACTVRNCVNPEHLWLGTQADNMEDAKSKGRLATGDRHGSRTKPERLARVARHGSRTKPEKQATGDRHGSRTKPERLARGVRHGSRTKPERLARGGRHGSRTKPERLTRGDRHGSRTHNQRGFLAAKTATTPSSHGLMFDPSVPATRREVCFSTSWQKSTVLIKR